jgi:predicted nucleotide-binding protein
LSPDDLGCLAEEYSNDSTKLKSRARQNTLLELGYFVGKLGREYVLAICKGNLEIPSDWHGVIYIPFDLAGGWKLEVVKELENMGMPIDKSKIV